MNDYYEILEVNTDAAIEQIKKQYHLLLQAWLPEKFASAESQSRAEKKLEEIEEAYSVLKDPVRRAQFDRERNSIGIKRQGTDQSVYEAKQEAREKAARLAREKYEAEEIAREALRELERTARAQRAKEKIEKAAAAKKLLIIRSLFIGAGVIVVLLILWVVNLLKPYSNSQSVSNSNSIIIRQTIPPAPTITPVPTAQIIFTSTPIVDTSLPAVRGSDGMLMVYVDAGAFQMGGGNGRPNENPEHSVALDAFWIDQTEVTNGQFSLCVQSGVCSAPSEPSSLLRASYYGSKQYESFPVVHVSWDLARIYCEWVGARLPTEAEWEKAARGVDGRIYPWGNEIGKTFANYDQRDFDTSAVGSYEIGKSPYGVYDMAGNVWEWVADWYGENYYSESPSKNPTGPSSGVMRVLRGGAWFTKEYYVRSTYRYAFDPFLSDVLNGFRCARNQ